MMQDMWNAPPGFRPTKSAPSSPAKPLRAISRTRSESFHVTHKVSVGDTPYVRTKNVQLVDKDSERAIPLLWAAINSGDRVDSALKDMAIVMKQQNRAEEWLSMENEPKLLDLKGKSFRSLWNKKQLDYWQDQNDDALVVGLHGGLLRLGG